VTSTGTTNSSRAIREAERHHGVGAEAQQQIQERQPQRPAVPAAAQHLDAAEIERGRDDEHRERGGIQAPGAEEDGDGGRGGIRSAGAAAATLRPVAMRRM
jgi:hypothetical protein